jgi:hypothetical protein
MDPVKIAIKIKIIFFILHPNISSTARIPQPYSSFSCRDLVNGRRAHLAGSGGSVQNQGVIRGKPSSSAKNCP